MLVVEENISSSDMIVMFAYKSDEVNNFADFVIMVFVKMDIRIHCIRMIMNIKKSKMYISYIIIVNVVSNHM